MKLESEYNLLTQQDAKNMNTKKSIMTKLPVQITKQNVEFVNVNKLSFSRLINDKIDELRLQYSEAEKMNTSKD